MRPIRTLFVANRGEIARRVLATARAMGMRTVAVYAESDRTAPYVGEADVAVPLPGTTAGETYLDREALVDAARQAGADAVHPGYGFLSEDADFAAMCAAEGLRFVGPPPEVIRLMGSKVEAKRSMARAGVPLVPGAELDGEDPAAWAAAADTVGYPILVKASAGGGGRGMRVVLKPDDLAAAVGAARREASSSFGDGTVFLERYVTAPRHVEVQVFGDTHGTVVHLGERDCSVQRRHQKVIEEAPAPVLDDGLRIRLHEAAVRGAAALGYVGAGTFEFLVDGDDVFFLEMNTRLQVEHPVTELVTGLDLVRLQLEVAGGLPLSVAQDDVRARGHAVEARLYAEDPAAGFVPAPGTVWAFLPAAVADVRYDTGVASGSEVPPWFDPMLAKVVAWGHNRREAAARLAIALRRTVVAGVRTNRDLLVAVLEDEEFLEGGMGTDLLERRPELVAAAPSADSRARAAVVAAVAMARRRPPSPQPATLPSGWRNVRTEPQEVSFDATAVQYTLDGDRFKASVGERGLEGRVVAADDDWLDVEVDGLRERFVVLSAEGAHHVSSSRAAVDLVEDPRYPDPDGVAAVGSTLAPLPGTVVAVAVEPGNTVAESQLLVVLEAMKMEHRVLAPSAGVVAEVCVKAGDRVDARQVLVVLREEG